MAWNPDTLRQASTIAGYGQPYAGNPYALTDDEQRRALAEANGMRAQAEKVEHELGGSMAAAPGPMTQIAQQQYAPPPVPAPTGPAAEAQMSPEERGKQNQQEAIGKIGSALGAIGSFYSGDMMGAANSIRGMTGGAQEQKKKQGGGGMDPNMLSSIMGMFGGGK